MAPVYSTYEAKARFGEILRKVRAGQRIVISFRGEKVAEIRPLPPEPASLEEKLSLMESDGILIRAGRRGIRPRPLAKKPGGLRRFLESRD
jgi:prevent-host-death family protein